MTLRLSIARLFVPAALLAAGAFTACTVKEDREPCPCYLNVAFADRETVLDEVGLLGWRDARLFRDSILVQDYDPYWVKAVHKGMVKLSSFRGVDLAELKDHYVTYVPGSQCDSLYAYHEEVDCTGEQAFAEVDFRKQFCTVFLSIRKSAAEMKDFNFLVEGNTCGFDLLDFTPVKGTYRYEPTDEDISDIVTFRIPRQVDDSMELTIWHREDGKYENLGTFPLGKYIVRTGYDWSAEVLQDVYIVIDLILGQITIGVDGWEDGVVYSYYEQ